MHKSVVALLVLFWSFQLFAQDKNWQNQFEDAKRLYKSGNYEDALESFKSIRDKAPNKVEIDQYIAQSAYRSGAYQEAAEAYKRVKDAENDTWSNYNQGNAEFRQQNLDKAIESYKDALRKDPNNEMARHNLAQALKQKQNQDNQDNQDNQNNQDNQDNQDNKDDQQKNDNNQNDEQSKDRNQKNQDNQNGDDKQQQQAQQPKIGREQTEQLLENMIQSDKKNQDKLKDKEEAVGGGQREKDW